MANLTAPAVQAKKGLSTKDLINIGVFTAVYFVLMMALGMVGFAGPGAMFVGHSLSIIANGIVVALLLARVPKLGALTILATVVALLMLASGHPWYGIFGIALGFIGDLIARSGAYTSPTRNSIGYAVFSLWFVLPLLPVFLDSAGYRQYITDSMSAEYADGLLKLVTPTTLVIWGVVVFVVAFGAGLLGHRVLKRHFERAGLAG